MDTGQSQPQSPSSDPRPTPEGTRRPPRAWWIGWGLTALGIAAVWLIDQASYRTLKIQYEAATAAHQQLAQQVERLRGDYRRLLDTLSSQQTKTQDLTRALSAKEEVLHQAQARMKQGDLVIQELQDRLSLVQHHFDLLQEEFMLSMRARDGERAGGTASSVELEKVVVTPPNALTAGWEGRVLAVHPEWQFVVLSLGWETVNLGDMVAIYHGGEMVAKARIERVQKEASVATLLPAWAVEHIAVDDAVRAL